jgi:aminoglycoside phosphotransferase (APT) family kinase protein
VLEHLEVAHQGDDEGYASPTASGALADLLAEIHRSSVGSESDLPEYRWVAPRPGEWHDARRVMYVSDFGLPAPGPLRSLIVGSERVDRLAAEMLDAAHPGLIHSDVHLDNVVFLADGQPVLLDWAHPGWGPAAIDLAGLLVSSVPPEDFNAVIARYRSTAEVTDGAVRGAVLHRILLGTLGVAAWNPETERGHRLRSLSTTKSLAAAGWLIDTWPDAVTLFTE